MQPEVEPRKSETSIQVLILDSNLCILKIDERKIFTVEPFYRSDHTVGSLCSYYLSVYLYQDLVLQFSLVVFYFDHGQCEFQDEPFFIDL